MPQTVLSKPPPDPVGYWLTPPELYAELDIEFEFDFDPCPYPRPPGFDGLKEEWGKSNWVNPPFEGKRPSFSAWARKAVEQNKLGRKVVMIMPLDRWFRRLFEAGAEIRSLGQIEWENPEGKRRMSPRHMFLFILD